jgi:hypothetical protein
MDQAKMDRRVACAALGVFLALFAPWACSSPAPLPKLVGAKCGPMDIPCGNGCIPGAGSNSNTVCCETQQGPGAPGSSYCVSGACYPNTGTRCSFNGTPTAFCCGPFGAIGSDDCPAGTHHCGVAGGSGFGCVANDQACCDPSKGQTCNQQTVTWQGGSALCTNANTAIVCGYCESTGLCISCPDGTCCHGDPCNGGNCSVGPACEGAGGTGGMGDAGSSGGGGSCAGKCPNGYCGGCTTTGDCCTGAVCISTKICSVNSVASGCQCSALGSYGVSGVCGDFADNGAPQITACGGASTASCNTQTSWCCPGLVAVQNGASCTCEDPTSAGYECPGQ